MRARGTGRILVRFRDPSWDQALAGTCALGGQPIGYGVGEVEPARLALVPCAKASDVRYIRRPTATEV
jgi:hypothetical protein